MHILTYSTLSKAWNILYTKSCPWPFNFHMWSFLKKEPIWYSKKGQGSRTYGQILKKLEFAVGSWEKMSPSSEVIPAIVSI